MKMHVQLKLTWKQKRMDHAHRQQTGRAELDVECRSKVKVRLETAYSEWVERIPAWIKWATQVGLARSIVKIIIKWKVRIVQG